MAAVSLFSSIGLNARIGWIWLKNFRLQLLAPGLVGGVGEGRHAGLAGIVHQDVAAPAPLLDRGGEAADRVLVEHVAGRASSAFSAALPSSDDLAAASRAWSRPQIATAAPSASMSRAVARPMPDVPPVTTATFR